MIPFVAANLSDLALVQHAPWGADGGAEETAYGLRCLGTFLASPSGMDITPDVIIFNWVRRGGGAVGTAWRRARGGLLAGALCENRAAPVAVLSRAHMFSQPPAY